MVYPSKQNRLWGTGAYVNKGGHLMFKGKPDGARCKMRLVCVPRWAGSTPVPVTEPTTVPWPADVEPIRQSGV